MTQTQQAPHPFDLGQTDFEALINRDFPIGQVQEVVDYTHTVAKNAFDRALRTAYGIDRIRQILTDDMMQLIMPLQNTRLGFRTDRPGQGYPLEVVRECLIEALLQGAMWIGNEMNIIAGNTYFTKEFFDRKIREFPGVSNFVSLPGVPRLAGDKGAIVNHTCMWSLNGNQQKLEREIAVRVNGGMGADAIIGKADRKMWASVYRMISGWSVPDGDLDGVDITGPTSTTSRNNRLADAQAGATPTNPPTNGNGGHHAPRETAMEKILNTPAPGETNTQAPTTKPAATSPEQAPTATNGPAAEPSAGQARRRARPGPVQTPPQAEPPKQLTDQEMQDICNTFVDALSPQGCVDWVMQQKGKHQKDADYAIKEAGLTSLADDNDEGKKNAAWGLKFLLLKKGIA